MLNVDLLLSFMEKWWQSFHRRALVNWTLSFSSRPKMSQVPKWFHHCLQVHVKQLAHRAVTPTWATITRALFEIPAEDADLAGLFSRRRDAIAFRRTLPRVVCATVLYLVFVIECWREIVKCSGASVYNKLKLSSAPLMAKLTVSLTVVLVVIILPLQSSASWDGKTPWFTGSCKTPNLIEWNRSVDRTLWISIRVFSIRGSRS